MTNDFGEALRKMRQDANISAGQLAREIGVSTSYISRVENGVCGPMSAARIDEVAGILGQSPAMLHVAASTNGGRASVSFFPNSESAQALASMLHAMPRNVSEDDFVALIAGMLNVRESLAKVVR